MHLDLQGRDTANTRSENVIVYKFLPFRKHKVQGVVLIPESIHKDLADMGWVHLSHSVVGVCLMPHCYSLKEKWSRSPFSE